MDEIPDRLPAQVRNRLAAMSDEEGLRRLQIRRRLVAARELHGLDQRGLQTRLNAWPRRRYYGLRGTDVGTVERCAKDLTYGFERGVTEILRLPPDWFTAPLEQLLPPGPEPSPGRPEVEAAVEEVEKEAKRGRPPAQERGEDGRTGRAKTNR